MSHLELMKNVDPVAVCEALGLDVPTWVEGELRTRCPHPQHDDGAPSLIVRRMEDGPKKDAWSIICHPCVSAGRYFDPRSQRAGEEDVAGLVTFVMRQRGHHDWKFHQSLDYLRGVEPGDGSVSTGQRSKNRPRRGLRVDAPLIVASSHADRERTVRAWLSYWRWKGIDLTPDDVTWLVEEWCLGVGPVPRGGDDRSGRSLVMPAYVGAGGGDGQRVLHTGAHRDLDVDPETHPAPGQDEFDGPWSKVTYQFGGGSTDRFYGEWRDAGRSHVVVTEGQSDTLAVSAWLRDRVVDVLGLFGASAVRGVDIAPLVDRTVVLLPDRDDRFGTGLKAAEGLAERLVGVALEVRIADLPDGTDACKAGRDVVLEALKSARPA